MAASRFDPDFTQTVIDAMGSKATPRTREVMSSLIRHVHDFAREVGLTVEEWMLGVQFFNAVGQMSNAQRNEGQRVSDVIGLESLVDEIAHKVMTESKGSPTSSTILGPFWSSRAPFRDLGASIIQDPHGGQVALMHGQVTDLLSQQGVPGAVVDVWQASSNGKYDFQDPENQTDNNLRGKFRTDEAGEYWFFCLKPTAYSLPTDGPAGTLLKLLDRHPMRPAHIHLMIMHPSYKPITTQIFPSDDPYLGSDSVFAVKDDLVVDFKPLTHQTRSKYAMRSTNDTNGAQSLMGKGDADRASLDLEYNVILAPEGVEDG